MSTARSANPMIGTVIGSTYLITRQIAVGGMGQLYEATHTRLAGRYAIKILLAELTSNEEVFARFQREAKITSSLRHPNIVSVIDFNSTPEGRPYLVMEYLEGRDLGDTIDREGPMALPRAIDILEQVVSGLAAAHGRDVVHRDLKPQNLFVAKLPGDGREVAKVLDFGISMVREAGPRLTREHSLIGTPQYMAPEQALGQISEVDHRADQFALATIAYELLSGRPAFAGESLPAIIYQVVHRQPPLLHTVRAEIPPAVAEVINRALSKQRDERFANIREFGRALVAAGRPKSAKPEATPMIELAPILHRPISITRRRAASVMAAQDDRRTTFGGAAAELGDDITVTVHLRRRSLLLGATAVLGFALVAGFVLRPRPAPVASDRSPAKRTVTPTTSDPPGGIAGGIADGIATSPGSDARPGPAGAAVGAVSATPGALASTKPLVPAAKDGRLRLGELTRTAFFKLFRVSEVGRSGQADGRTLAFFKTAMFRDKVDLELGFDAQGRLDLSTLLLDRDWIGSGPRTNSFANDLARSFVADFVGPTDRGWAQPLGETLAHAGADADSQPASPALKDALAVYTGQAESWRQTLRSTTISLDHLPGARRRLRIQLQRSPLPASAPVIRN